MINAIKSNHFVRNEYNTVASKGSCDDLYKIQVSMLHSYLSAVLWFTSMNCD